MDYDAKVCPECGDNCWRDSADVGVGIIYGPWGCSCGWSELGSHEERQASSPDGWYTDPFGVRHNVERIVENCARFGFDPDAVREAFRR